MRGDPAPRFQAASTSNPRYIFDTVAGRYVVLCFFVLGGTPGGAAALRAVAANRHRFDDERLCSFGVTRIERYLVGCYAVEDGGHFAAHRRFAVSINLNDDFDGGGVSFPEHGPERLQAAGGRRRRPAR